MTSALGGYLSSLREHVGEPGPTRLTALGHLALRLGAVAGRADPGTGDAIGGLWADAVEGRGGGPAPAIPDPPAAIAGPWLLGAAYEALSDPDQRRRGLHYTPQAIASRLAAIALDGLRPEPVVCDPACGGGAFLLAVAERLLRAGATRRHVVDQLIVGIDIDPLAVRVATTSLLLWAGADGASPRVAVGDALAPGRWPSSPPPGFDLVIGNPPFQSQLGAATARSAGEGARLRATHGTAAKGYADTSSLFLVAAAANTRPDGRVLLIQPQSVLAGRDTEGVRRQLAASAPLEGLWVCDEPIFEAATRVCAPVLRPGTPPAGTVARWYGPAVDVASVAVRPSGASWASLASGLRRVPEVQLAGPALTGVVGATAGFRQQFYGLAPHVREATGGPDERPLVTSGAIDPLECAWSEREVRFAKQRWRAPVVDLETLERDDPRLAAWVCDRLVPKVLVATQTRVVEAVADVGGRLVPSTPVVSVEVAPDRVWHVVAALSAPPVSAWALHQSAGTALSPDALKLSATQVRAVPSPVDHDAWDEGAAMADVAQGSEDPAARRTALIDMGTIMVAAYRVVEAEKVLEWWVERLPRIDRTDRTRPAGLGSLGR